LSLTVESEVINILEHKGIINITNKNTHQSEIIEIVNKLISEYMDQMGYTLTNTMFLKGKLINYI